MQLSFKNMMLDVQVYHQNPKGSHCTMGNVGLSMGASAPSAGSHIPLSVLSHCTMGKVGLFMGVHCPSHILLSVLPYCTIRQVGPLYKSTVLSEGFDVPLSVLWAGGTVYGSPLFHLRAPILYSSISLPHRTGGIIHVNPLYSSIPLYHGTLAGGTVHGSLLSHLSHSNSTVRDVRGHAPPRWILCILMHLFEKKLIIIAIIAC